MIGRRQAGKHVRFKGVLSYVGNTHIVLRPLILQIYASRDDGEVRDVASVVTRCLKLLVRRNTCSRVVILTQMKTSTSYSFPFSSRNPDSVNSWTPPKKTWTFSWHKDSRYPGAGVGRRQPNAQSLGVSLSRISGREASFSRMLARQS